MGKLQDILSVLLPDAWAASMEAESREWRMQCPCGAETSIWDMGGIRWKACGNPRRVGICSVCGRRFVGTVYRGTRVQQPPPGPASYAATVADPQSTLPPASGREHCLLWIDGIGCWLLCVKERITLGGPRSAGRSDAGADIQLLADLNRQHATIGRCGETYMLAAEGPVSVNGRGLNQPASLKDGDVIGLGRSVVLRFRVPNAWSRTARLEFVSDHRPAQRIDGVLLMDQECLLGASADCHVVCDDWSRPVILFRRDGKLWCKLGRAQRVGVWQAPGGEGEECDGLYVNGCRVLDAAPLRDGSLVTFGDCRLRIEMPTASIA